MNRLLELYRHRELLFFLTWRDVKIRYKQTLLGAAWAVLQPLAMMLIFTAVIGNLSDGPTDGIAKPIFYYLALIPWTFFQGAISNAGNSLVTNTDLLTKVYFPRVILPASTILAGLVDLAIATLMLGVLLPYFGIAPDWEIIVWPLVIFVLVILALGAGMLIAAINVLYRDVKYALPFVISTLLFLSPIMYPTSKITNPKYLTLMKLNPLSGIIETSRAAVIPSIPIDWAHFGISIAITLVLFWVGSSYFYRVQRRFADLV